MWQQLSTMAVASGIYIRIYASSTCINLLPVTMYVYKLIMRQMLSSVVV